MRTYCLILLLLSLFSCKKESENLPPKIVLKSTIEGKTFQPGDTVLIRASISDDVQIETVKLSLINTNTKYNAGAVKFFQVHAANYELSYEYVIDNKAIDPGPHYFEISADDGEKQTDAFLSVQLQQTIKKRMGLLLVSNIRMQTDFYQLKTDSTIQKRFSVNSSYQEAKINPYDGQLWILPEGHTDMLVYDLETGVPLKNIKAPVSQAQNAFSFLFYDSRNMYVGTNNGSMQGYNYQFTDIFTYTTNQQYNPEILGATPTHLLLAEQGIQFNSCRIRLLYRLSGGLISSSVIQKNIVGMQMISKDRALLISKTTAGHEVLEYDVQRGATNTLLNVNNSNDSLIAFESISNTDYLFATKKGLFTFKTSNQLVTVDAHAVEQAKYDAVNNEIIRLNKDTLFSYDANNLQLKNKWHFGQHQLTDFLIWNNH